MDVLTFLTKLLEYGAWPTAAFAIILLLRRELKSLLPMIKKLKAGPLEVELDGAVDRAANRVGVEHGDG